MDIDFSKIVEVYIDDVEVSEVYFNYVSVWKKPKILDYVIDSTTITKYTGSEQDVIIPASYSTITADDGSVYYVEGDGVPIYRIGDDAFRNTSVVNVEIPDSIEMIGSYCFYGCSKLTSITIPDSVASLGDACFMTCTSLSSIKFPKGLSTIPSITCAYCESLATVNFPSSLTTINNDAFVNCGSLKSISLPATLKTISDNAFLGCSSLTTVNMSATPTSIGEYAFAGTKLSSLPSSLYNCASLGKGCFATNTAWRLIIGSAITTTQAERVRATTTGATGTYNGVSGYGGIYASYGHTYWKKTSGDNGTSGSITTKFTFDAGIQSWAQSVTSSGSGVSTSSYLYNSSNNPPSISGSVTSQSLSNVSSTSNQSSIGYYTHEGVYYYRLDYWRNVVTTCLVEGTNITLADGSYKKVEDLNYDDLLRVWNLETGQFDYQYPLAIVKGEQHGVKYRLTIEDGTYLEICGQHDIFDPVAHMFRTYGEGAIHKVEDDLDYYVMKDNGSETYTSVKITSIELIEQEVTAYCVITSGMITAFANDVMIGLGILNLVPITEENKFSDVFEKSKPTWYNYNRFRDELYSGGTEDLITGMNLLMVDVYHKDVSGLGILLAPFMNRKPLPLLNGKEVHYIAFDDNGLEKINAHKDDIIVLPKIKSEGKNKWYILGEYKYLNPGDSYRIKVSTVIKAV